MFLFVIVAEGVDLVYDFGRIFQKVVRPHLLIILGLFH